MTDFIGEIKRSIASTLLVLLNVECDETNISCPANEFGAKTALPLIYNADASLWQSVIDNNKLAFTLWGIEYLDSVSVNGGHILFNFCPCLYTAIIELILKELPPHSLVWSIEHNSNKALERAMYAKHRMRMLARKSGQDTSNNAKTLKANNCFTYKSVQRAILLIATLIEPGIGKRALELRLNESSSALLTMTHCVAPRERAKLFLDCSRVAEAAFRVLGLALDTVNNL